MDPENISSLILSTVICVVLLVVIFYQRVINDFSKNISFRGIKNTTFGGVKRSGYAYVRRAPPIRELFRTYKVQYVIADTYTLILFFVSIYGLLGGRGSPQLFLIFYLTTAMLGYSLVFLEYKKLIIKYWKVIRFIAAVIFSCSVLFAGILVDKNIQLMTSLPAEFFPTSQTALLILFVPLILLVVFYVLSMMLYVVNVVVLVQSSSKIKTITIPKFIFNGEMFLIFMLLAAGTPRAFEGLIELGYNEYYDNSFIEYSYNLNGNVCKNINENLFISHLRTGGVSVAKEKDSGGYCFSVFTCDRGLTKYNEDEKYQGIIECDK